jgi:hypothetical protein
MKAGDLVELLSRSILGRRQEIFPMYSGTITRNNAQHERLLCLEHHHHRACIDMPEAQEAHSRLVDILKIANENILRLVSLYSPEPTNGKSILWT